MYGVDKVVKWVAQTEWSAITITKIVNKVQDACGTALHLSELQIQTDEVGDDGYSTFAQDWDVILFSTEPLTTAERMKFKNQLQKVVLDEEEKSKRDVDLFGQTKRMESYMEDVSLERKDSQSSIGSKKTKEEELLGKEDPSGEEGKEEVKQSNWRDFPNIVGWMANEKWRLTETIEAINHVQTNIGERVATISFRINGRHRKKDMELIIFTKGETNAEEISLVAGAAQSFIDSKDGEMIIEQDCQGKKRWKLERHLQDMRDSANTTL